jgi:diguanylate cyclase (GGDEF)-like protein/PAS domain S-box-containing protein
MADRDSFYRDLLDSLSEGVYFTDRDRRITFWSKGAERLTGYSSEEVLGRKCSENILIHVNASGLELCKADCPLSDCMNRRVPCEADVYLHHKAGHRVPVLVRANHLEDSDGNVIGAVEIFSNNAMRVQMQARLNELEQLALVDMLTGLPNRRHLESHVFSRLEELRRNQWSFGVLFVDVDGFKGINDAFGHDVGDKVLQMVGRTLDGNSRYFDLVGRWGGEEFLAIIGNAPRHLFGEVAERMRLLVARSELTEPREIRVTISIGGALAQPDDSVESLIRRADEKLYEAKKAGRNCVRL